MPLDVFVREGGDAWQPPLGRTRAPLFAGRITPLSDDGVPRKCLATGVRERDLAGIAEGADTRLGSELVTITDAWCLA